MRDWTEYFEAAKKLGPNPFYDQLAPFLGEPGTVLELGFGAGTGVLWWLDRGWKVIAVDVDESMCEHLREIAGVRQGLEIIQSDYQSLDWPNVDVVCAVFALFFDPPERFWQTWEKVRLAVENGALFAGQLIGPGDDWAKEGATSVTREQLDEMIAGLRVLSLQEVQRRGKTVYGAEKDWHVFHLVLGPSLA